MDLHLILIEEEKSMPNPISFGELDFQMVSDMAGPQGEVRPESPFRIAVLGDFSGRTPPDIQDTGADLAVRKPLRVDRDNVDTIVSRLNVRVTLPGIGPGEAPETLRFNKLDDFHPDHIYQNIALFQTFAAARKKTDDPRAFPDTVRKKPGPRKPTPAPEAPMPTAGGLLDDVLAVTEQGRSAEKDAPPPADSEWDRYIQELVSPHVVPDTTDQQAALKTALDDAAGDMMRAILHLPAIQRLEAIWRALAFLVYRVETDDQLQVFLIDVSKEELAADLARATNLRDTGTYRLLVEQTVETPGAAPYSLLVGAYEFGPEPADVETLGRMAKIARQTNAAFVSGASDRVLGCESLARTPDPTYWHQTLNDHERQAWNALRKLPEAGWIALALPRFLLRLPYGTDTDPTERFNFEEMPDTPIHEHYLWGNPAFACAYLLASAFSRDGWQFHPGTVQDIDRLPIHTYKEGSDICAKPCGEVLLTERAASAILDAGPMALVSYKDQDRVRLIRFQSILQPATQLAGPWRST